MALHVASVLHARGITNIAIENDWPTEIIAVKEIWLVGGDGTLNYFINKYPRLDIPIALFAGGTGNDFHWKLYGSIKLEQQIDYVLQCGIRHTDLAKCNHRYFLNTLGIGFDGEVLKDMSTARMIGGHLGYLIIVVKKIFTYKEKEFHFSADGVSFSKTCLLCNISNSSRTGGGFMVSPLADIYDGYLNLLYCTSIGIWRRLIYLSKVEKGSHLSASSTTHMLAKKLSITSDQEVFYQLDGELLKDKEFNIEIISGGMSIKA